MAVSTYDRTFLTKDQQKKLQELTAQWEKAHAAGDRASMESAHAAAETIRAGSGYSGGGDGAGYTALREDSPYTPAQLPHYQAQTQAVNEVYDAARDLQLSQLKSAYDSNLATLEAASRQIPQVYAAQRDSAASAARRENQAFNEYAAASGINTGAGSQVRLAQTNQLQRDMAQLGEAQAQAQAEAQRRIDDLKVTYQNEVATAIAKGEYDRAQALLDEFRTQEESIVASAEVQADNNYRGWTANQQRMLEIAQTLGNFGDFSGYSALGYTPSQVELMRRQWITENPLLAYNMGEITQAEYLALTGVR